MKKRLDVILVEKNLAISREKAQALILTGNVLIDDKPADKVGVKYDDDKINLRIRGIASKYVSRGGDKIEPAFDFFKINLTDAVTLDLGASTGGFTDCMLQRGAKKVYAVDVGTNQLDLKLRKDERVVVYEKTHAKALETLELNPKPQFATIDVSFIGLRNVLQYVVNVLAEENLGILALIKPQFELGPEYLSKGGVVRDEKDQLLAVQLVTDYAIELGLYCSKSFACPLRGEKSGNQEYFVLIKK